MPFPLSLSLTFLLILVLPLQRTLATYTLLADYTLTPAHFFSSFSFFTSPDPTGGPTTYVDFPGAASAHLIGWTSTVSSSLSTNSTETAYDTTRPSTLLLRTLPPLSTRLTSHATYTPGTLLIASINHLPTGCGVWPALWLLGSSAPWPDAGEVDIIEGVNLGARNIVSLHTSAGCIVQNGSGDAVNGGMEDKEGFWGTMVTDDCFVDAEGQAGNAGCGIVAPASSGLVNISSHGEKVDGIHDYATLGPQFNAQGGGVYIFEWPTDESGFSIWFFPRSAFVSSSSSSASSTAPQTLKSLLTHPSTAHHIHPDPRTFGVPLARFASANSSSTTSSDEGCDFSRHFSDMQIVLNTALCGDWAGDPVVWAAEQEDGGESCAVRTGFATCEEWVMGAVGDEEAWSEAFWEVGGLWVFGERD